MAPSFFGRFLGNTVSGAAGQAIGGAVRPTLDPLTQEVANETWPLFAVVPVDPYYVAAGVAQGQVKDGPARAWAAQQGYGDDQFNAMIAVANGGPGIAQAFNLWRRGDIDEAGFRRAAKREALEQEWIDALVKVKNTLLEPAEIAKAVHRGVMANDGLLVAVPPSTPGKVPAVPPSPLDPIEEAAGSGMTPERLRIITGNAGLPPGIVQMLQLLNRGEITPADFLRGVGESNLRNEWGPVMLNLARQLLTATEYVDAHLRGYITPEQMHAGTALHGMTPEDTDLLFKTHGRPITVHQLVTGEARGGKYDGPTAGIPPEYIAALKESSIKPPYYNLAYANRYTYPSGFQIKSEAPTDGYDFVHGLLLEVGWKPELAAHYAAKWTGAAGPGAKADPHVSKAQTQLWTTLHRSYLAGESTAAEITAALPRAGVSAGAIPDVLATWDEERTIIRKQLSPAQVKKAYVEGVLNPDTGAAWTKDEATAALVARGYSTADATTFLEL